MTNEFCMQWPPEVQGTFRAALDGIINNLTGRQCILWFPPTVQTTSGTLNAAVGSNIQTNVWSAGPSLPLASQQDFSAYAGPVSVNAPQTIQVESSTGIIMVIYQEPARFNNYFPIGQRHQEGTIVTEGFVTDMQSVRNCTRMETNLEIGNTYAYKLAGEPVVPGKLVPNRYFYALWTRV